jgi:hypothetical protein
MIPTHLYQSAIRPLVKRRLDGRYLTRRELKRRARESDRFYPVDEQREVIEITRPSSTDYPAEFDHFVGQHEVPRSFVCELTDATVFAPQGSVRTADGRWVLECARGNIDNLADAVAARYRQSLPGFGGKKRGMESLAVPLAGPWSTGYFHWFTDYLPCLRSVRRYAAITGREPVILIPPNAPTWLRESLRAAGYPESRWRALDENRIDVERLVVPSKPYGTQFSAVGSGVYSMRGYRWIRDRVLNHYGISGAPETGHRIYVSRDDARERRVLNEAEVLDALEPFGFERYELGALSYPEQVERFAGADAVVAPHGAGLTNAIYARDVSVCELFGSKLHLDYYLVAEGLGFDYRYLLATADGDDMVVDVDRLRETVEQALD